MVRGGYSPNVRSPVGEFRLETARDASWLGSPVTGKMIRHSSLMGIARLVSIPAKPRKRDLLLPVILDRCFPEDRPYKEEEVNQRLAALHPDVAALRRYLVDGGLMTREVGIYRRTRSTSAAAPSDTG
jgi:hypothetical protein